METAKLLRLPDGPWNAGWALALHTERSQKGGWRYTEIGKRLSLLKYNSDRSQVEPLARDVAAALSGLYVRRRLRGMVPVPPSNTARAFQPVLELACRVAELAEIPLIEDCLVKAKSTPMTKTVKSRRMRQRMLEGAFVVRDTARLADGWILLFDDLYQTGATLGAATKALKEQGRVSRVYALVVTRTRTRPL